MNLAQMESSILEEVELCIQIAVEHFKQAFYHPKVKFDLRGTSAGQCRWNSSLDFELRFNPGLIQDNYEDFIYRIVPHEVAHMIAMQKFRDRGHGPGWKRVMRDCFKREPTRCHSMDISKVTKTVPATCGCGPNPLTVRRAANMGRGYFYTCQDCKEVIKLV